MRAKKNNKLKNKNPLGLIVALTVLFIFYYLSSGYIFFWGWYLFCILIFLVLTIGILGFIYIIFNEKYNNSNNNRYKQRKMKKKKKSSIFKLIGNITLVIFMSIFTLALYWFTSKDVLLMTLDIPNVIKGDYMKSYCEVEKVSQGSKNNRQVQYVIIRDFETNEVFEIKFQHRYKTLYYKINYNIMYLPHSKLGVAAEFAK